MKDKCKEIQEKFPDYLAGQINKKEKEEIMIHLEGCADCKDELNSLDNSILASSKDDVNKNNTLTASDEDINKIARKTRKHFTSRIIKIVLITLAVIAIVYLGTIAAIRGIKHDKSFYNGFSADTLTSALIPYKTHGLTEYQKGLKSEYDVQYFRQFGLAEEKVGTLKLNEDIMTGELNIFPTEYQDYLFMNTAISNGAYYGKTTEMVRQGNTFTTNPDNLANAKKRLEINRNNTIVLLDLVFKDEQDLNYIKSLYKKYDIYITWAALENKGSMSKDSFVLNPKYVGFNLDISEDRNFSTNVESYKSDLTTFIEKSKKFKNPLIDGINATYKDAVDKNLTNIKGIRVTGPTSEVYSLVNDINISKISIVKFDFWNWK